MRAAVTHNVEEALLFFLLRKAEQDKPDERPQPLDLARATQMPVSTCMRILELWVQRGWWDYGAYVRTGWLSDAAPGSLFIERARVRTPIAPCGQSEDEARPIAAAAAPRS